MDGPFSLKNKTVAVTGAFGRVGKGIAKSLFQAGAKTLALDIKDDTENNSNIGPAEKGILYYEYFDITKLEELSNNIGNLEDKHGPIDVWVNSAYPRTSDWGCNLEEVTIDSWRKNIDLQLNSYCICSNEIAKRMAKRKTGAIINISSIHGIVAPDFSIYEGTEKTSPPAYSVIKAGIVMYSKWLASYFGKDGVRVNVICPGAVYDNQSQPFLNQYNQKTLLKRMAKPDEIGNPVVFLASDAASYITGAVLIVDGGFTII